MNRLLANRIIYPAIQLVRKESVYSKLSELERTQWFSKDEIHALQLSQLRKLLCQAQLHVPYYRKLFQDIGFDWRNVSGIQDIAAIPILTKDIYKHNWQAMIAENFSGKIDIRRTSGSTGIPLILRKPREVFSQMRAIMYRYYRWHGIDIGSRQGRILGHPLTFKAAFQEKIQDFLLNKSRLDPAKLTEENVQEYLRKARRNDIDYLYGYPSAMIEIGKYANLMGIDLRELQIPLIISTGENLYDWQRHWLEAAFGAKIVNEYGCSEFGIIAFECPEGGVHLSSDNLIVEFVNSSCSTDGIAEILITVLFNLGVPLIRYKIGDMAVPSSVGECPCGRSLALVLRIEGRESEMIRLADGRFVHSEFFHYLGDALEEVGCGMQQFRVIKLNDQSYEMEIVADPGCKSDTEKLANKWLQRRFGVETDVRVRVVKQLPRDKSGKFRYFVSNAPEGQDSTRRCT